MSTEEMPDNVEVEEAEETAEELGEGEYRNTFMEMWENILKSHINVTKAPLDLTVTASILSAYPWITHATVNDYRTLRASLLEEALDVFFEAIGDEKEREKRYKESVKDWSRHKELYMEIIAAWSRLVTSWGTDWAEVAATQAPEGTSHAAISDVSGILLSNDYGLTEGLKTLKDFSFSQEDRDKLDEMVGMTDD